MNKFATLLIDCPDRCGLVAAVTNFICENNGNILDLDQYVDREKSLFFMRVKWDLSDFSVKQEDIGKVFDEKVGKIFGMKWNLYFSDEIPKVAIFVSKLSHCLYDILARHQSGEWNVEIPLIISNHPDLEFVAKQFSIDYKIFPIDKSNKVDQEKKQLDLLKSYNIDFIVLARYMQILTKDFIKNYPDNIINIHHSFLPAFPGSKPYHSAYERGVKIIGATSHYVTEELDAGPIIQQDIVRVSHNDSIEDFIRKGKDLEKVVLSRAVKNHLDRNILVHENRTVNFE